MKISFIRISGFRGARGTVEIKFPAGFAIICGRNGTGKSTLCDAIEFALTGRLERYLYDSDSGDKVTEKGESILDYIWWRGPGLPLDKPEVVLGVTDDQGVEHVFRRGRDGASSEIDQQLRELICATGVPGSKDLADVCRTTLFRDEEITRLSVDLPETNRFSFVRSAVGFGGFAPIEDVAKRAVVILRNRVGTTQTEYDLVRKEVAALTARLSELRSRAGQAEDTSEAQKTLRYVLSSPGLPFDDSVLLTKGRQAVADRRIRLDMLLRSQKALQEIDLRITEVQTSAFTEELATLERKAQQLSTQLEAVIARRSRVAAAVGQQQGVEPSIVSRAQLVEHGRRLGLVEGKCPLCGSPVTKETFDSHLTELLRDVQSHSSSLSTVTHENTELLEEELRLRREVEDARQRAAVESGVLDALRKQREQLMGESAAALGTVGPMSVELVTSNVESTKRELSVLERAVVTLEASQSYHEMLDIERQLEVLKQRSDLIGKRLTRVQAARERAQSTADTIHRLSGELVDEQVAALSPLLAELFMRLRPHVDWQEIRYRMRGDVRRFLSLEVGEGLNPRFLFSSGQRRAMGIAFLLAVHLSRTWCRLQTLILDDPVQHVDDFRALHLAEVLSAIRKRGEQVICTVEDAALADLLCRRLRSTDLEEGTLVAMDYKPGDGIHLQSQTSVPQLPRELLRLA